MVRFVLIFIFVYVSGRVADISDDGLDGNGNLANFSGNVR